MKKPYHDLQCETGFLSNLLVHFQDIKDVGMNYIIIMIIKGTFKSIFSNALSHILTPWVTSLSHIIFYPWNELLEFPSKVYKRKTRALLSRVSPFFHKSSSSSNEKTASYQPALKVLCSLEGSAAFLDMQKSLTITRGIEKPLHVSPPSGLLQNFFKSFQIVLLTGNIIQRYFWFTSSVL